MGCCRGKRGQKIKDDGTQKEKPPFTVKTPKSRGIWYIPKVRMPSSMCITEAAMQSTEVAVSKDVVTGSLKKSHMYCTLS